MSNEHKLICRTMTLATFKPNEAIVKQGDPGDSFFYILTGIVKIVISIKIDLGIDGKVVTVDKYLGDLKAGQTFGELALIYGTPRSATIIAVTNAAMIKLDKTSFDLYVKDIFENQMKDQIDFMKICPIFTNITKAVMIKLAITTDRKKINKNQIITKIKNKSDFIYIIRRGTVKVIKPIDFIKDENALKKRLHDFKNYKSVSYDDLKVLKEINEEKLIEILSNGPTPEDYSSNNTVEKNITLETLKMGDIFPSYYCVNNLNLDVYYEAESPCELIAIKVNDLSINVPDAYKFIKNYAKPYPSDEFLRKFYYYNSIWINFKSTLKQNIIADSFNNQLIKKNSMRQKLAKKKDLNSINLPMIFSNKQSGLPKSKKE
jgi:CRP-like cAMP-binding protein